MIRRIGHSQRSCECRFVRLRVQFSRPTKAQQHESRSSNDRKGRERSGNSQDNISERDPSNSSSTSITRLRKPSRPSSTRRCVLLQAKRCRHRNVCRLVCKERRSLFVDPSLEHRREHVGERIWCKLNGERLR